ncbi:MAG: hypothetical protein ACE3L7_05870 [Candidatus Pristimantibacillus sp.]
MRQEFSSVIEAVRSCHRDVDRFITHRAPFADMLEHFDTWLNPESKVIKAMVELVEL